MKLIFDLKSILLLVFEGSVKVLFFVYTMLL